MVCQSPGTLSKVPLSSIKLPGQHRWLLDKFDEEEDKRRASNPAPAAPAAAAAAAPVTANATTATAAKPNTTVPASPAATVEVAPLGTTVVGGQCKAFSDNGHARLVLCVDKPVWDAASGVEITRANLTNNGSVALCNVTMKVGGRTDTRTQTGRQAGRAGLTDVCVWVVCGQVDGWGKHVHSVWPEWVRDSNWALYFNINQTINIGQSHRHRQKAAARQGGRV